MKRIARVPKAFSDPVAADLKHFRPKVFIRTLDCSSAVKRALLRISDVSVRFRGRVLKVGKKLLEIAAYFVSRYPDTSFSIVVALLLTWLVGNIPFLGLVLAPIALAMSAFVTLLTFARESILVSRAQRTFGFLRTV